MAITPGADIDSADFVDTSSGAADEGKVAKLNADGKLSRSFITGWTLIDSITVAAPTAPTDVRFDNIDGWETILILSSGAGWSYPSFSQLKYVQVSGDGGATWYTTENSNGLVAGNNDTNAQIFLILEFWDKSHTKPVQRAGTSGENLIVLNSAEPLDTLRLQTPGDGMVTSGTFYLYGK